MLKKKWCLWCIWGAQGTREGVGEGGGEKIFFPLISLFDEAFVVERPDRDKAQTLHRVCDDCEAHHRPFEEPFAS